jgi:hypothetical protein
MVASVDKVLQQEFGLSLSSIGTKRLVGRVVTVSVETANLVKALPLVMVPPDGLEPPT